MCRTNPPNGERYRHLEAFSLPRYPMGPPLSMRRGKGLLHFWLNAV